MTSTDKPANVDVPERREVADLRRLSKWLHEFDGSFKGRSLYCEGTAVDNAIYLIEHLDSGDRAAIETIRGLETDLAATAREIAELREENNLLAGRINDLGVIANDLRRERDRLIAANLTAESVEVVRTSMSELLSVVRIQNGNLHDDINQIQSRAENAINLLSGTAR